MANLGILEPTIQIRPTLSKGGVDGSSVYEVQSLRWQNALRKDSLWSRTFLDVEMCLLWRVY